MRKSIFFKLFSGYFLVSIGLSFLILLFSFHSIRSYYIGTISDDLVSLGTILGGSINPLFFKNDTAAMNVFARDTDHRIHKRITVIASDGMVLADSEKDPRLMENHRARPEVSDAFKGAVGTSIRNSSTLREGMLYVALPILKDGRVAGVLRVSMPVKDIDFLLSKLLFTVGRFAFFVLFISLVVALLISRKLSLPITRLTSAAQRVARGDLNAKVQLENHDELGDLAESFNHMTGELRSSFSRLSDQKEELNAILSSLQESLFVIGSDEKIRSCNHSFAQTVSSGPAVGRFYWEVVRDTKFGELLRRVKAGEESITSELALNASVYLCSITSLSARQEYVVVMHDITQIKNLEKIKKDFIGNVSHELRTPLTAIKGYVETLEETVSGESQNYLAIIKRHTDRLIRIVEDLLILSQMEDTGFTLERLPVDIAALLENVIKIFAQRLSSDTLGLTLDIVHPLPMIIGDAFKLEQVFINLIDNAIKYTEKGGITIRAAQQGKEIVISVADTGIGIPNEHLSRIFERFYVVDKSRSRKAGGTGLGLAIVKHIILLHSGSIDVQSEYATGTKFTIRLPVQPS